MNKTVSLDDVISLTSQLSLIDVEAMAQAPRIQAPERIIAASAIHLSVPVISKDSRIQGSGVDFIW